jgi:hypothetical protein
MTFYDKFGVDQTDDALVQGQRMHPCLLLIVRTLKTSFFFLSLRHLNLINCSSYILVRARVAQ